MGDGIEKPNHSSIDKLSGMIIKRQKSFTKGRIKVKQGKKIIRGLDEYLANNGASWPELLSGSGPAHEALQKADFLNTNYSRRHLNKKFRFRHSKTKAADALDSLQLKMQSSPRTNYTGQKIENMKELKKMIREERKSAPKRK